MDDIYLIGITALLPLTALMLVLQVNPYQALVMRGILGAIAALVYALFGAADVALTEALVGTMLSITLYAVAVRSSMEMRLGWVPPSPPDPNVLAQPDGDHSNQTQPDRAASSDSGPKDLDDSLIAALRPALRPSHLRLEVRAYPNVEALAAALQDKQVHSALISTVAEAPDIDVRVESKTGLSSSPQEATRYQLKTRVKRLAQILSDRLPAEIATIEYVTNPQPSTTSPASQRPLVQEPS